MEVECINNTEMEMYLVVGKIYTVVEKFENPWGRFYRLDGVWSLTPTGGRPELGGFYRSRFRPKQISTDISTFTRLLKVRELETT